MAASRLPVHSLVTSFFTCVAFRNATARWSDAPQQEFGQPGTVSLHTSVRLIVKNYLARPEIVHSPPQWGPLKEVHLGVITRIMLPTD